MQWTRFSCCLIFLTALAPNTSFAQSTNRTLALDECIQLALQHNLDIQIQRLSPLISGFDLSAAYGAYEPTLNFSLGRDHQQSPGGVDEQNRSFRGSESDQDSFNGSINGLLPWGMRYAFGGGFRESFGTAPVQIGTNVLQLPFDNTSGQVGFMELRQPLMRGAWYDNARYVIALRRADLRGSEIQLELQIMSVITAVETAYYNLIYAGESVRVQATALQLAERLLSENRKRVEVGALAPLDEKQSEAEVAARRADLLQAQRTLENQQNVLKNLLTDDYATWHGLLIEPSEKLSAVPYVTQLTDSWIKGLTMRPELKQLRLSLETQNIVIKYQKNLLYPQLDLVGTFGYNAGGVREFSQAFGQIDSGDNPFHSIRAELSIPLGNRTARNNLRAARATRDQAILNLKRLEQTVMVEIDDAVGQVKTSFQRTEATRQSRLFAEAALDAEQKKLENGKSTSFFVLQLQRDLVTAASTEIRALADYNIALTQLALQEGATLDRHRIDLKVK